MLTYSFPKISRLLRSKDFRLCAKYGKEHRGCFLHIQVRKTAYPGTKLGLTVSRRYDKAATHRNRFKRLVREAFRLSQHELPDNVHINIHPRPSALKATLPEIQEELVRLINR